jgi:hypothetical protein
MLLGVYRRSGGPRLVASHWVCHDRITDIQLKHWMRLHADALRNVCCALQ